MRQGDLVLAMCMIGLQKQETENQGHFCHEDGDMLVCEFVGQQRRTLDRSKVQKYESISHGRLMAACKSEFPAVATSVREACEKLLAPEDYGYKIDVSEEDMTVSLCGGYISVEPAAHRTKVIGGIREFPGWEVSVWKDIPATRDNPPDTEQIRVKIARGDLNVARIVVETIFTLKANSFFENISESRMAHAWEDGEL